ncbi:class I SAM-dependent methyltransferase [Caldimonas tepidiphila]|uniref:class I SAM-dependent methyltransferase n=1 Tax=Caldimonas tepidiphila TaxID=2315841 RepID=UPI000E5BE64A|nr:methyltransferase domain-containing protein [Caldimonas tepidiphila]
MDTHDADKRFSGSIPEIYDRYLVPLIFESYAQDLARRVANRSPRRVLETAAGTGVVTRMLARTLPESTAIVATDLNQAMLNHGALVGTSRPVEWRQADAQQLPFEDGSFNVVVCQYGVMFYPDKARAHAEARRVLAPGGVLIFNTWDRLAENEFAETVHTTVARVFPADPPRFLERTPYGYFDPASIERDLVAGGITATPEITLLAARSRAGSARIPAMAYCQGAPLRNEIEARDPAKLGETTDACAEAIARRFGSGPVDGKIQALIVTVER